MSFFAGGFMIINLIIALALTGLGIYLAILLIYFLKAGTKAFNTYVEKNSN